MINVLKGEMSLVGPRPERPFFVEKLSEDIPFYKRRLKVRPGITCWAQVKHKYDETIEDVKEKLRYDLFYIENMSLRNDMKIWRGVFRGWNILLPPLNLTGRKNSIQIHKSKITEIKWKKRIILLFWV